MIDVLNCILNLLNVTFIVNGYTLSLGSVVLGTALIFIVCSAVGKLFN